MSNASPDEASTSGGGTCPEGGSSINPGANDHRSINDSNSNTAIEVGEPPAKIRKINPPAENDDVDEETCPICLDIWGNSGKHRLVALKCGHLFGFECVERWLNAQAADDKSCPTCNSKASLEDLRFIYARRVLAADTSEITRLQQEVETLAKQETETKFWRFDLEKNLEMCKDGGCRVLTYNCRTYELYVSQKSSSNLFSGYGIRKVSCIDNTVGPYVHLHSKPISDIVYSQSCDLLLSVGVDKIARIVERDIPNVSINAGIPLWSCAWDCQRTNEFYVGGDGGMVYQYDFRNPSTRLGSLTGTGDMSRVLSVCSTEYGLLSCQLNSCWLWEPKAGEWSRKAFILPGEPYMSMCYDMESQTALISMRCKGLTTLALCSLTPTLNEDEGAEINLDNIINASSVNSVMSRATFCRAPGSSWVAAYSESDADAGLYLHGLDGSKNMCLPAYEPVFDVCSVQIDGTSVLAALSESRLRIYKAVQTDSNNILLGHLTSQRRKLGVLSYLSAFFTGK